MAIKTSPQEGDPLLNSTAKRAYLGNISTMTDWRWEKRGDLPPPDVVYCRRRFWRRSTLDAWIEQKARQTKPQPSLIGRGGAAAWARDAD